MKYDEFMRRCFPDSKEVHISIIVPKDYDPVQIYRELVIEAKRYCNEMLSSKYGDGYGYRIGNRR